MRRRLAAGACAVTTLLCVEAAQAGPAETSPYVGWGYGQIESPRVAGMGGALRASANSTEALYLNPANMALARVYHLGALAMIWPRAARQTYSVAAMDSVVSASHIAGGITGSYTVQDPEGVDRTIWDLRGAMAFPFSKLFFAGASVRYVAAAQAGYPRDGNVTAPVAAANEAVGRWLTFDAGLTVRPIDELLFSAVGYNLTSPDNYFLPVTFSGAAAYVNPDLTIEFDWLGDFDTYQDTTHRFMAGGEYLIAGRVPLRVGYQFDQGSETHSFSGGVGYTAREFSVDVAFRQSFQGEPLSSLFFGFKYHLESTGIAGQ